MAIDMVIVLGMPVGGLLLFAWHKHREQKRRIFAFISCGMYHGSGERVDD
jgi:hypothetical protein